DKKMGLNNLEKVLSQTLKELKDKGRLKGKEYIYPLCSSIFFCSPTGLSISPNTMRIVYH
ncbi:unnamed protein product, partial [marine sediment metagenome]